MSFQHASVLQNPEKEFGVFGIVVLTKHLRTFWAPVIQDLSTQPGTGALGPQAASLTESNSTRNFWCRSFTFSETRFLPREHQGSIRGNLIGAQNPKGKMIVHQTSLSSGAHASVLQNLRFPVSQDQTTTILFFQRRCEVLKFQDQRATN